MRTATRLSKTRWRYHLQEHGDFICYPTFNHWAIQELEGPCDQKGRQITFFTTSSTFTQRFQPCSLVACNSPPSKSTTPKSRSQQSFLSHIPQQPTPHWHQRISVTTTTFSRRTIPKPSRTIFPRPILPIHIDPNSRHVQRHPPPLPPLHTHPLSAVGLLLRHYPLAPRS